MLKYKILLSHFQFGRTQIQWHYNRPKHHESKILWYYYTQILASSRVQMQNRKRIVFPCFYSIEVHLVYLL